MSTATETVDWRVLILDADPQHYRKTHVEYEFDGGNREFTRDQPYSEDDQA
jgi:hypothetical protein